jgi:hypothetical protein
MILVFTFWADLYATSMRPVVVSLSILAWLVWSVAAYIRAQSEILILFDLRKQDFPQVVWCMLSNCFQRNMGSSVFDGTGDPIKRNLHCFRVLDNTWEVVDSGPMGTVFACLHTFAGVDFARTYRANVRCVVLGWFFIDLMRVDRSSVCNRHWERWNPAKWTNRGDGLNHITAPLNPPKWNVARIRIPDLLEYDKLISHFILRVNDQANGPLPVNCHCSLLCEHKRLVEILATIPSTQVAPLFNLSQ